MNQEFIDQIKERFGTITKFDEPLSKHSTFKLGGNAKVLIEPPSAEELMEVFQFLVTNNIPYFILGGGANVLLSDDGFHGVVLKPRNRDFSIDGTTVRMGAGVVLAKAASETAKAGLTGLEWGIAVPGTLGGSIRGNAGAYGGEIKDTLVSARVYDGTDIKELSNRELDFEYRSSRVKKKRGDELVIDAVFELKQDDPEVATAKVKLLLKQKFAAQPMGEFCAGCLFKNIELIPGQEKLSNLSEGDPTEKFFEDIKNSKPEFIKNGKVPAGWIIEQLGYKEKEPHKGIKVSEKHANFLVNTGEGTAEAVKELAEMIKKEAKAVYGITLEEEVQFVA